MIGESWELDLDDRSVIVLTLREPIRRGQMLLVWCLTLHSTSEDSFPVGELDYWAASWFSKEEQGVGPGTATRIA